MGIPTRDECYEILCGVDMPEHMVAHSIQVCRVAAVLTAGLAKRGVVLDADLVGAAALLHDITKPRSIETRENHARTGADLLLGMGHDGISRIVSQHVRLDEYFAAETPNEAEVVNYSDKRILHDKIVPLKDRMTYIMDRYARTDEHRRLIGLTWHYTRQLEKRLFQYLSFEPDDLEGQLKPGDFERHMDAYRKVRERDR
jgi:uncharacterized protein